MKLGTAMKKAQGENWVLNQYYDYLGHRNVEAERQALYQIMTRPERIRTGNWSASSMGRCKREQQFVWLGFKKKRPSDDAMNIFTNGDYVHLRHQAVGFAAGYLSAAEVPVDAPYYRLRGTMDGILTNGAIAEWKSINSYGFGHVTTFGPKEEHKLQVHGYMLATGIDRAHVIYENKDTNKLKEFVVTQDDELMAKVTLDLVALNTMTDKKKLMPMLPECRRLEGAYRYCPFADICEDAQWPTAS